MIGWFYIEKIRLSRQALKIILQFATIFLKRVSSEILRQHSCVNFKRPYLTHSSVNQVMSIYTILHFSTTPYTILYFTLIPLYYTSFCTHPLYYTLFYTYLPYTILHFALTPILYFILHFKLLETKWKLKLVQNDRNVLDVPLMSLQVMGIYYFKQLNKAKLS